MKTSRPRKNLCSLCALLIFSLPGFVYAQPPSQEAEIKKAIEDLRAHRLAADKIEALKASGFQLISSGRYQDALMIFEALVEVAPDQQSSYGAALALFNLRRVSEAKVQAHRAAEMARKESSPAREADALVLLAVIVAVEGDNASALKAVRRAVELAPESFDAQLALGRALYGAGDMSNASAAFRKSIALRPKEPQPRFFLATSLEALGEYEQARVAYSELIRLQPDKAEGHLGLGVLLTKLDASRNDEAISELQKAVSIRGDLYEARIALGRALIKSGRHGDAVEHLKAAATLAPNNPEPYYQLAIAYRRLGNTEAAAAASARVKEINSSRRGSNASANQKVNSSNPE
jgi:tetratricopeptide (TPR) repeat protein